MSEPLRGVIVCHGVLARALVDATAQISGMTDVLVPVSNSGCDRGDLEARVEAAVGTMLRVAAERNVQLMLPLVTRVDEVTDTRAMLEDERRALGEDTLLVVDRR